MPCCLAGYVVMAGTLFEMVEAIQRLRALENSTPAYKLNRLAFYLAGLSRRQLRASGRQSSASRR